MTPFFSICIPFYNTDEQFLCECLESVNSQSFRDFEVIIVDDGSRPEFGNVVDRALARYTDLRLLVLHMTHEGLYEARRRAYACARGLYCINLDSDDCLFAPEVLKIVHDRLVRGKYPDVLMVNAACDRRGVVKMQRFERVLGKTGSLSPRQFLMCFNESYSLNSACLKIVKSEIAEAIDIRENHLVMCEDRLLTAQIFQKALSFEVFDAIVFFYRQHEDSTVHKKFELSAFEQQVRVERHVMRILGEMGIRADNSNARIKWVVGDMMAIRDTVAERNERIEMYQKIAQSDYANAIWSDRSLLGPHVDMILLAQFAMKGYFGFFDMCVGWRCALVRIAKCIFSRF